MLRRGAHRVLGITAEMIDWWFSWAKRAGSALQDLISRPPLRKPRHPAVAGRRAQARTLSRNERQAHWFSTAHPHEDMGFGPEAVTLHYVSPQDYGLSKPAFAPGEATAICT
jgi:DAPG hydrolase PhiG domain